MTIICVDHIAACLPNANWRYSESCHMFSDDPSPRGIEELHRFAERLGLKREWFQDHRRLPHYDLTRTKRKLAVRYGAKEVSRKEVIDALNKNVEANRAKEGH